MFANKRWSRPDGGGGGVKLLPRKLTTSGLIAQKVTSDACRDHLSRYWKLLSSLMPSATAMSSPLLRIMTLMEELLWVNKWILKECIFLECRTPPFAPLSLCFEKVFRSQTKMICEVPPVGLEVMYPSSSSPSPPPSSRVSIGAALHTPDIPLGGEEKKCLESRPSVGQRVSGSHLQLTALWCLVHPVKVQSWPSSMAAKD